MTQTTLSQQLTSQTHGAPSAKNKAEQKAVAKQQKPKDTIVPKP